MFGGRTADEYALKSDLENISWNDLTDKPFSDNTDGTINQMSGKYVEGMGWSEGDTVITWDGNTDGLMSILGPDDTVIYLVSDFIPAEDYKETIYTTFSNGYEVNASLVMAEDGLLVYGDGEVFFALQDNVTSHGVTFPNAGTYFPIIPVYDDAGNSEQVYPVEVRVSGTIHPIDQKFLSSGVVVVKGKRYADGETHSEPVTLEKTIDEIAEYFRNGKSVELWLYDWFGDSEEQHGYNGSAVILKADYVEIYDDFISLRFSGFNGSNTLCTGWSYTINSEGLNLLVYYEIEPTKTVVYGGSGPS